MANKDILHGFFSNDSLKIWTSAFICIKPNGEYVLITDAYDDFKQIKYIDSVYVGDILTEKYIETYDIKTPLKKQIKKGHWKNWK
jgi:hypothetical protein